MQQMESIMSFMEKMFQVFGSTNNSMSLAGKHKSGKTDFFSTNGQLNSKGFDTEDLEYLNTVGTTFGLSKARLRFEAKTKDKLAKFVYGLEVGTINWGDQDKKFGLSGDGITQETRFVYAEIKAPAQNNIDHIIRAGLQPTKISNWVWSETAAGLTYHGKSTSCNWMIGWYRGDEDAKSNSSDNNYFVFKTAGPLTPELELGLFMIYEHAGSETSGIPNPLTPANNLEYDRKNYYLGTSLTFDSSPFRGKFEFIYQGGDIDFLAKDQNNNAQNLDDLERSAMLMNLDLSFQVNKQLKLGFNSLYVSGDDNPTDLDAKNFDAIDVDVKVGMILFKDSFISSCDRFVSDAPYLLDKGLIHHALTANFKLNKKHSFFGAIRSLSLAKDVSDDNDTKESSIGTELDFKYAYKLNKYVKLRAEAACLFPGGASDLMTADDKDADTIVNVASGIQFSF
jgi:hypothetical protein